MMRITPKNLFAQLANTDKRPIKRDVVAQLCASASLREASTPTGIN